MVAPGTGIEVPGSMFCLSRTPYLHSQAGNGGGAGGRGDDGGAGVIGGGPGGTEGDGGDGGAMGGCIVTVKEALSR